LGAQAGAQRALPFLSSFCCMYKYENVKKLKAWGRSQARHDDGLQKASNLSLLTLWGMTNFRSCHEETRRSQVQILPTPPSTSGVSCKSRNSPKLFAKIKIAFKTHKKN
jgi:hypothetical protein